MPVTEMSEKTAGGAASDFAALEKKILRAVEMLRTEREARQAAEAEVARLSESTMGDRKRVIELEREIETLRAERTEVKQRVDAMLEQMDALIAGR